MSNKHVTTGASKRNDWEAMGTGASKKNFAGAHGASAEGHMHAAMQRALNDVDEQPKSPVARYETRIQYVTPSLAPVDALSDGRILLVKNYPSEWSEKAFYKRHLAEAWQQHDSPRTNKLLKESIPDLTKTAVSKFVELYAAQLYKENPDLDDERHARSKATAAMAYELPGRTIKTATHNIQQMVTNWIGDKTYHLSEALFTDKWLFVHQEIQKKSISKGNKLMATADNDGPRCSIM